LDYKSKREVKTEKEDLERIRNGLAHGSDLLSAAEGNPERAIADALFARRFAERVRDAVR